MKKRLLQAAKWAWMGMIFAGVTLYLIQNFSDVTGQLNRVSPASLLLSLSLLIIGRLLIVLLIFQSVTLVGWQPPLTQLFRMAALSELAKYLPGGVWHFVGRAGYYRAAQVRIQAITRALMFENLWLMLSAAFAGLIYMAFFLVQARAWILAALALVLWWWILSLIRRAGAGSAPPHKFREDAASMLLQMFIWMVLGGSYAVLLPDAVGTDALLLTLGAFAISWLVGFVSVFAPGGIGVREAVLAGMMAVILSPAESLVWAGLHRLLWVGVEVLLALLAGVLIEPGG